MAVQTGTAVQQSVEHQKAFAPFDASTFPSQLLWLGIAFCLLYVVVSRLMLPRVSSVVEERNNRIKADLGLAEKLKNDAEAALVNYNQLVADARSKAADIGKEMRQRLDVEAGKERARLKAEMAAKFSEAENWIAAAKAKALTCVEEIGPRWQVQSSPS